LHTLRKTFRIIEDIVAHQGKGLSFSEILSSTSYPKASIHRILKSLVEMGYLRFENGTGKYFGGIKLLNIGAEVSSHFDLKTFVRPHLLKLYSETKHTCHLGIRNGNMGVYLDKIESRDYGIKLFSDVGKNFPLHCTGMGKVLLAFMNSGERKKFLSGKLKPYTTNTIVHVAPLRRELKKVQEFGYAVDREEITRGIICVAAAIENRDGEIMAAISVTFPSYIDKDRGIQKEIEAVRHASSVISDSLRGK
jgi:DNA-binding IclR family transcriptional regulator